MVLEIGIHKHEEIERITRPSAGLDWPQDAINVQETKIAGIVPPQVILIPSAFSRSIEKGVQ